MEKKKIGLNQSALWANSWIEQVNEMIFGIMSKVICFFDFVA